VVVVVAVVTAPRPPHLQPEACVRPACVRACDGRPTLSRPLPLPGCCCCLVAVLVALDAAPSARGVGGGGLEGVTTMLLYYPDPAREDTPQVS
jgi:hypothetical protein